MAAVPRCKASLGQKHSSHFPAYPHPDDVDFHKQQHPIENHQKPREAEAQLREADGMVVELDKLDGLSDESQGPIDEQSCEGERGVEDADHACAYLYKHASMWEKREHMFRGHGGREMFKHIFDEGCACVTIMSFS